MTGGYERELADAEFGASTTSAAVAAGVHDEIGGPGAGLGVSRIVDGVEGDGESVLLPLFSCSSVICFWRSVIKTKADRRSATQMF
jgi:hypothetical protein